MPPVRVVIATRTIALSNFLFSYPDHESLSLATIPTAAEIRETLPRLRAQLAIVDLELVDFSGLAELCSEFPATAFVCVHRLADDAMWMQALAAGAVDCCGTADLSRILENADRYIAIKKSEASTAA